MRLASDLTPSRVSALPLRLRWWRALGIPRRFDRDAISRPGCLSALVAPEVAGNPLFDLPNLIGCIQESASYFVPPPTMAAEHERTIKHLRREERTGRRDNEVRGEVTEPVLPRLCVLSASSAACGRSRHFREQAASGRRIVPRTSHRMAADQETRRASRRTVQSTLGGSKDGPSHGLHLVPD